MIRAIRFFPMKQLIEGLIIGRKTPETPLSVIKHPLENERQLFGEAVISKRLEDEKVVLNVLEQQQAAYKEQIKRTADELIEHSAILPHDFHCWWGRRQDIISFYKPENKEILADSIDWLRARQALAKQHQSSELTIGWLGEFSIK